MRGWQKQHARIVAGMEAEDLCVKVYDLLQDTVLTLDYPLM